MSDKNLTENRIEEKCGAVGKTASHKIPKKLHWFWFGPKPVPDKAKACIESWHRVLPDWEVNFWNEDNYDYSASPYAKAAYEHGYYSFVEDIATYHVLHKHGGIVFDNDVEILKPLDRFLDNSAFFSLKSIHSLFGLTGCVTGSVSGNPLMKQVFDACEKAGFKEVGEGVVVTTQHIVADVLKERGFKMENEMQVIDDIALYPYEYLCPRVNDDDSVVVTDHTYAIHHFSNSWMTPELKAKYKKYLHRDDK